MKITTFPQILSIIKEHEFIVIDHNIMALYPDLKEIVMKKVYFEVSGPESAKNLETYEKISHHFLKHKITRKHTLLAIGGGATSDLAGFVAATILRGINWEVIPTTLLAMIDAAIGGKVGINCEYGKNLMGAFHLPKNIYLSEKFLETLPTEHTDSGLGELIKYTFLEQTIYQALIDEVSREELILRCGQYKEELVARDFKESGERQVLNLGHTFGHGMEKTLSLPHGIAVYFGLEMMIKCYASDQLENFMDISAKLGLNLTRPEKMNFEKFWNYIENDKKRSPEGINIIIPHDIDCIEIKSVSLDELKERLFREDIQETYFS